MDEDPLIVRLAENEDFYEGYSAGLFKAMNLEKLAKNSCELNDDRSAAVIGLLFAAFSGALVGWIAHMIMVAIRNG